MVISFSFPCAGVVVFNTSVQDRRLGNQWACPSAAGVRVRLWVSLITGVNKAQPCDGGFVANQTRPHHAVWAWCLHPPYHQRGQRAAAGGEGTHAWNMTVCDLFSTSAYVAAEQRQYYEKMQGRQASKNLKNNIV